MSSKSKSRRQVRQHLSETVGFPKKNQDLPEHIRKGVWTEEKAKKLANNKYYMYLSKIGHRVVTKRDDVWAANPKYEVNKRTKKNVPVYHTGPETMYLPSIPKKAIAESRVPDGKDGSAMFDDWEDWVDNDEDIQIRVSMPREYLVQFLKTYNFAINDEKAGALLDTYAFGKDYKEGDNSEYWIDFIEKETEALREIREKSKTQTATVDENQIAVFIADSNALRKPKNITVVGPDGREVGVGHNITMSAKPHLDEMIRKFIDEMENDDTYQENWFIDVSHLGNGKGKPKLEAIKATSHKVPIKITDHARFGGFEYRSSTGETIRVPANILHTQVRKSKDGVISGGKNAAVLALKELGLDDDAVKMIADPVGTALSAIAARKAEKKANNAQSKNTNIILKKNTFKGAGLTSASASSSEHGIQEDNEIYQEELEVPQEPEEIEEEEDVPVSSNSSSSKNTPKSNPEEPLSEEDDM